jgi:hypothetical protein
MFSLNGCKVTLADGTKFSRQRVSLDENGLFTAVDRRSGEIKYSTPTLGYTQLAKTRYRVQTESGDILVIKSGCNCGR